jgi:hypothetical protein
MNDTLVVRCRETLSQLHGQLDHSAYRQSRAADPVA